MIKAFKAEASWSNPAVATLSHSKAGVYAHQYVCIYKCMYVRTYVHTTVFDPVEADYCGQVQGLYVVYMCYAYVMYVLCMCYV